MTVSQAASKVTELVPLLFVQDIGVSVGFYGKLGFEIAMRWESEQGDLGWCRMERDGVALMLQQACEEDGPAEGRGHGVGLFLLCDDVDALRAEFLAKGLDVAEPTVMFYGMKQIFPKDPDGYMLCFQSRSL